MAEEYLDNCLLIDENEDAYREKTRIAEVAAATLCRLNTIMKQMKNWREDRVKLRSNIWRLKLALRVAGKETNDILHADPLIEHQRAEIKRLEESNQALRKEITEIKTSLADTEDDERNNAWISDDRLFEVKQEFHVEKERLKNEIRYLKSRLREAEEGHEHSSELEHLKCKLKHFMMVDHTMEIILTDIVNKVAETIANLSEELVNTNEHLHRSKVKNDDLNSEIDKLKAMVRFKTGWTVDHQKRTCELDNLTKRLKTELGKFKGNFEDRAWNKNSDYQNHLRNAGRLANDLRTKLRNDREALLAAGDPDSLKYMKRIVDLRVCLMQLRVEFANSNGDLRSRCYEKTFECQKYSNQISVLGSTLKEITDEIDQLKDDRVMKYCRIGGVEGLEYLKKIEELDTIVEKATITMNGLNRRSVDSSNGWEDIEKLEDLVRKVCQEIKQLELIVVSNDSSSLHKRIEQLEDSVVRCRVESNEKDERAKALQEERSMELKDAQKKIDTVVEENKTLKERAKKLEEKTWELQQEQESLKKDLDQLQQVKHETNVKKKKLQSLRAEKEELTKEIGKMRESLQKRNDEIKNIIVERDATEKTLNAKITDLGKRLQVATKENEKLQTGVNELERKLVESANLRKGIGEKERSRELAEKKNLEELQRLKAETETTRDRLDKGNREIIDLKARLDHFSNDKARLESSISHLESKKEILVYQLGVEKATAEERQRELAKLMSEYDGLNDERTNLMSERERLKTELTDLKAEKELLEKSIGDVRGEYSRLEEEVKKYKYECNVHREKIRKFETSSEDLARKLEEARAELRGAGDKIRRLEFENSMLGDNFDASTAKNAGLEGRVQVLLTEKNDLATRINVLDGENVSLKDQLNKAKTANEYSSVESNKLRTERDKARSENRSLQNSLEETEGNHKAARRTNEELKMKLNDVYSEYRILENQLSILELTNAALRREKVALQREYLGNLRSTISKMEKEGDAIIGDVIFCDHGEQIAERGKSENHTRRGNPKSDRRANDTTKSAKNELKKLMVENEALKFELLNLKSQNFEIKTELTRTKEHQRQSELTKRTSDETAITPVSNKLEIANLYCKEVNGYPVHCLSTSTMELQPGIEIERLLESINKLKVENVSLKMEVNTLRYNFVVNFAENEKRRNELRNALEELRALKAELTKLRDEKESLRVRLDTAGTKLDQLESERTALKDEVFTLRKTNSDLRHRANELRCDYQKLKETNVGFEDCIIGAIKEIKKYTMGTANLHSLDGEFKALLKKYISNEELLQSINEQGINFEETQVDSVRVD